ncbi:hypothetical protein ACFL6W_06475 [Thermodesulfobacteriota bacterium]
MICISCDHPVIESEVDENKGNGLSVMKKRSLSPLISENPSTTLEKRLITLLKERV